MYEYTTCLIMRTNWLHVDFPQWWKKAKWTPQTSHGSLWERLSARNWLPYLHGIGCLPCMKLFALYAWNWLPHLHEISCLTCMKLIALLAWSWLPYVHEIVWLTGRIGCFTCTKLIALLAWNLLFYTYRKLVDLHEIGCLICMKLVAFLAEYMGRGLCGSFNETYTDLFLIRILVNFQWGVASHKS